MRRLVVALLVLALPAQAAWKVGGAGKGLYFQGKPIMPLCLDQLPALRDGKAASLNLESCTTGENAYLAKLPVTLEGGSLNQEDGPNPAHDFGPSFNGYGWAAYKVLGRDGDRFLISMMSSGGGSGVFTDLYIMERHGDLLTQTRRVSDGDRCSSGLSDARVTPDGQLTYQVYANQDTLLRARGKDLADSVSQLLDYSAMGCIAKVEWRLGPNDDSVQLSRVILTGASVPGFTTTPAVMTLPEGPIAYENKRTLIGCFNKIYNRYTATKHLELTPAEFDTFVGVFAQECVK